MLNPFIVVILILVLSVACFSDIKQKRIPNLLTLPLWVVAPLIHLYLGGSELFVDSLYGLFVMLGLTFPLFIIGWMGAGDIKLMTAVGALMGYPYALYCLASILISGLLLSILILLKNKRFFSFFNRYLGMLGISIMMKKASYLAPAEEDEKLVLPYAVPIAIGTLCTILYMQVYLH